MDQLSRYYSRRSHSVAGPGKTFTKLRVLDLDVNIDRGGALTCLSRSFSLLACWKSTCVLTLCDGPIKRGENR